MISYDVCFSLFDLPVFIDSIQDTVVQDSVVQDRQKVRTKNEEKKGNFKTNGRAKRNECAREL